MGRKARQCPPARMVGEVSPEWWMRTRALLTHLYLEQKGIEHGEIDVWHKDHPEDVHTFTFN